MTDEQAWRQGRIPADGWYFIEGFEPVPVFLWVINDPGEGYGVVWGWNERDDSEAVEVQGLDPMTMRWRKAAP